MKFKNFLIAEKFIAADKIKQRFAHQNDSTAYINVHINPDNDEVIEVINDFKETDPEQYKKNGGMDFVRGFFDIEGNLYVWYGTFFHDNVERFLKKQAKTKNIKKNERFRFAWLKGDKYLTLEGERGAEYFNDAKDYEEKRDMIKRLVKAFPMIETKYKGIQNIRTNVGLAAWVKSLEKDKGDSGSEKSSNSNSSNAKSSSEKSQDGFNVGDVVEMIKDDPSGNDNIKKGMKGKIVSFVIGNPSIGVEFIKKIDGNSCQGKAEAGHGWYVSSNHIKKVSEEKPKLPSQTKDLAKIGDTIVFGNNYAGGGKAKILAVVWITAFRGNKKEYHYMYKSRKKDQKQFPAEKFLTADHIHWIDGKHNIKKVDEPFSSIISTGDYIEKIIPNPERVEKKPDNLYEPKRKEGEGTYRAYTDRR